MKNLLIITMLLGIGYSECNESNWQQYHPEMQECYLVGADLSYANLEGVNLSYSYLTGANLEEANLSGANLTGADLYGVNLTNANLEDTNLYGASLLLANLSGANLYGVNIYQTNLSWANLCNLTSSPSGDVCEQSDGITDEDGDGYDDTSYENGSESVDTNSDGLVDEFPVITVLGESIQIFTQTDNSEYTDYGANCQDEQDGSLSQAVEVSGQIVNLQTIGTYTLYYDCADSDGNQAITESRTVIVQANYSDENDDGYDDTAYEAGANSADPCYGVVCDDDPEMICICGECTYEDEQGETGGTDCSYDDECFEAGATSGDLNLDGTNNVLDVVALVDMILNP